MVVPSSIFLMRPASVPAQSMHRLPAVELNPYTGWLKTLNASTRNWALTRSVTGKFFITAKFAPKNPGPVNLLRATAPKVPGCGRWKGPAVAPGLASVALGVKNTTWCLTGSSDPADGLNDPTKFGRQGPVSLSAPHWLYLGVQGTPLLQMSVQ